jgi:oligopeptide transport system substrate-binding protein
LSHHRVPRRLLAILLLAFVSGCGPGDGPPIAPGPPGTTVLHRGNGAEPQSLDPHRGEGVPSSNIQRDLFDGLVTTAPDGSLIPGAASSWTISEDGLVYSFELREDGRWSNGDPVTAEDFVFSLRRAADPATLSNYSQILAPILNATDVVAGRLPPSELGVEAAEPRRLIIRLGSPTPYFLELLTHSMTFPVHPPTVRAHGASFARPGRLVSNGAYMLEEWVVQSHVKLVRNPHYHDRDAVEIEAVYFYPIENPGTELKRYRAGELHWTDALPHQQIAWVREHLADDLQISPYLGTYYFGFNTVQPPFAGRPGLRRALSMVIDREIITTHVTGGGEIPAYGWIPPLPGYTPQRPEWADWPAERRLAEARRLYEEAGYGPRAPLTVKLFYNTSDNHKRIALAVAAMWKQALGVRTQLINQEFKVFLDTRRRKRETEVFRAAWIGDFRDPYTFAEINASTHGMNDTGYSNPRYDALLEASMKERDPDRRRAQLEEAERILLADQPLMPIYFYVNRRVVKPWVKGWQPNLLDLHPTRHFRLEAH